MHILSSISSRIGTDRSGSRSQGDCVLFQILGSLGLSAAMFEVQDVLSSHYTEPVKMVLEDLMGDLETGPILVGCFIRRQ